MNELRQQWAQALLKMLEADATPGRVQGVVNLLDARWRVMGGARG